MQRGEHSNNCSAMTVAKATLGAYPIYLLILVGFAARHHGTNTGDQASTNVRRLERTPPQQPSIPHRIWLPGDNKRHDSASIVEKRYTKNVANIIKEYRGVWNDQKSPVTYLDDDTCLELITQVEPRLEIYYKSEHTRVNKLSICKSVALYLFGGYYFDNGMQVIEPIQPNEKTAFISGKGCNGGCFMEGIVASAPGHTILGRAIRNMLRVYETKGDTTMLGPIAMANAYDSCKPSLQDHVELLEEHTNKDADVDVHSCTSVIRDATTNHEYFHNLDRCDDGTNTRNDITLDGPLQNLRILIYITTHMSQMHVDFLRHCWPAAVSNSPLLRHSDILFFTTEDPDPALISPLFKNNVTVKTYVNPGYQEGAILAMREAAENRWFDGYDWVVRVNPDVIIRNDTWILETMLDETAEGIFVDCWDRCKNGLRHCTQYGRIHTDFYAFRPKSVDQRIFLGVKNNMAEIVATIGFRSIMLNGGDTWLPDVGPHRNHCRVRGKNAPVIHDHNYVKTCQSSEEGEKQLKF